MPSTVYRATPQKEVVGNTDSFHPEYHDIEGRYNAELIGIADGPEAVARLVEEDFANLRRPRENSRAINPEEVRYFCDSDVQQVVVNVNVEVPS